MIYFCEESNKCFAANPSKIPMAPVSDMVSGTPAMNPQITANTTAAAVIFDTLAFENIGVLSCADISQFSCH